MPLEEISLIRKEVIGVLKRLDEFVAKNSLGCMSPWFLNYLIYLLYQSTQNLNSKFHFRLIIIISIIKFIANKYNFTKNMYKIRKCKSCREWKKWKFGNMFSTLKIWWYSFTQHNSWEKTRESNFIGWLFKLKIYLIYLRNKNTKDFSIN